MQARVHQPAPHVALEGTALAPLRQPAMRATRANIKHRQANQVVQHAPAAITVPLLAFQRTLPVRLALIRTVAQRAALLVPPGSTVATQLQRAARAAKPASMVLPVVHRAALRAHLANGPSALAKRSAIRLTALHTCQRLGLLQSLQGYVCLPTTLLMQGLNKFTSCDSPTHSSLDILAGPYA